MSDLEEENQRLKSTLKTIEETSAKKARERKQAKASKKCDHCKVKFASDPNKAIGHTIDKRWDKYPEQMPERFKKQRES
jgi:hypothetical protein